MGGFLGLLVASVPGLLIGSVAAIAAVEWFRLRDWKAVLRASGGYLSGYLLSMVVEIAVAIAMMAIFFGCLSWNHSGS